MCDIEIEVKDYAGKKKTLVIDDSIASVGLSYLQLTSVDLTPFSEFENLRVLTLYSNELQELDLSPLSNCKELRRIRAGINHIPEIDLSPLSSCKKLEIVDFGANGLHQVDLRPLEDHHSLQTLRFDNNRITSISLEPIASCANLRFIDLSVNKLNSIDLWPLASCMHLERLPLYGNNLQAVDVTPLLLFGSPCRLYLDEGTQILAHPGFHGYVETGETEKSEVDTKQVQLSLNPCEDLWQQVSSIIRQIRSRLPEDSDILVQLLILKLTKIEGLGLYDGPLDDLLGFIDEHSSYDEAKENLYDRMLTLVEKQLEANGATMFIDIDRLSTSRASKIIPKVLERKREEIEDILLTVQNQIVDLRPLWLTSYGYEILKSMELSQLEVSTEQFQKIRKAFKDAGFVIRTRKGSVRGFMESPQPRMSRQMIQHILSLIDTEGSERIVYRKSGAIDLKPIAAVV
ncbi:MAG: leucine-rich repeat domain-containing protein [Candidatus Thorarchaeota archaeon]|nr:leucine-rich repeat domain-containing protein [Candidatus Thorarchaeota archaeon]